MNIRHHKDGIIMGKKYAVLRYLISFVLMLYSIIVLFPMVWTAYSSLKSNAEFYRNPWALPTSLHFENYINAWHKAHIGNYFLNSLIISMTVVIVLAVIGSMAAYVLSRSHHGRTAQVILVVYLLGMLVPIILGAVPTFLLLKSFGLLDRMMGLILIYVAFGLPFTVFVLQSFYKTIPHEMEEAALIDGCSMNRTFWEIVFPLARSGILTVSIFNFISFWNEYVFALTFIISEQKKTLSLGLINLMETSRYETNWGALFAGLIIVMIPTILIYTVFQNRITSGLTIGAVKG
jgi:ABC-type sugar transport system, permease component